MGRRLRGGRRSGREKGLYFADCGEGRETETPGQNPVAGAYQRLVVPVSGTAADDHAVALALRLGARRGTALTVLYVVEVPQSMPLDAELPAAVARGEAALARAEELARSLAGKEMAVELAGELLQSRSIGAAVVDEAIARNAEVIVLTATVRRRHGRPTIGETISYVMLNAPCEVVVGRLRPTDPSAAGLDWR